jgi:hypothetical protein
MTNSLAGAWPMATKKAGAGCRWSGWFALRTDAGDAQRRLGARPQNKSWFQHLDLWVFGSGDLSALLSRR